MNKTELVKAVAERSGIKKVEVEKVINAFIDIAKETLKKREEILLVGFGSFKIIDRKEKKGRNPRTGEPITIPAKKVVKFNPGKDLTIR